MPDFKIPPTVNGVPVTTAAIIASSVDDTIDDADLFGYVTGGVLVNTAWSNIKALLTTLFSGLYVALTGTQNIDGLKTFLRALNLSPATTTDDIVTLNAPAGHTGAHSRQTDNGIVTATRVSRHYTTSIAVSGGSAVVFSFPLPANRAVIGNLEVVTAQRSAANVQRHQTFSYKFSADVFGASAVFTATLMYSENNGGQPATTVTVGATGLNVTVTIVNNSTTKAITAVTCLAEIVAANNA